MNNNLWGGNTPLYKAITSHLEADRAWMHTPGHKGSLGAPFSAAAPYDLTEITGLDSLFEADGPIAETEQRYTRLYETEGTFLSAGGSTLCIQAMLALVQPLGKHVLAGRNIHLSAVNAMALLGLLPVWLWPDRQQNSGLPGTISPGLVEKHLAQTDSVAAVYLTSPNYFGELEDIAAIAAVCKKHSVPLLVDNAHGAHLRFGSENLHPIHLGASLCCDSLHKTLPVLTGGALLHTGDSRFAVEAKQKMSLFGSTSPSYLIMLSMDMQLPYFETTLQEDLWKVETTVDWLRRLTAAKGFPPLTGKLEPNRLTLGFGAMGYSREAFLRHLHHCQIEPEYLSDSHGVLLFSQSTKDEEINRVVRLIKEATAGEPVSIEHGALRPKQVMPLRQAVLGNSRWVSVAEAGGHISAQTVTRCPPGVPLIMPGEEIDNDIKKQLQKYGVTKVKVVE